MLRGSGTFEPTDWNLLTSTLGLLHCPHNGTEVPCDPCVSSSLGQSNTLNERTEPYILRTGRLSVTRNRELLQDGDSARSLAAIYHVGGLGQPAQFQEQFP